MVCRKSLNGLETEGDARVVRLSRTKRKDGPREDEHQVQLRIIPGAESGCTEVAGSSEGLTAAAEKLWAAYEDVFSGRRVSKAELRNTADMPPASFHRGLTVLLQTGRLVQEGTDSRPIYTSSRGDGERSADAPCGLTATLCPCPRSPRTRTLRDGMLSATFADCGHLLSQFPRGAVRPVRIVRRPGRTCPSGGCIRSGHPPDSPDPKAWTTRRPCRYFRLAGGTSPAK